MYLLSKKKIMGKDEGCNNRFLTTVTVLGSPGPIRFIVNEKDSVSNVIYAALKIYARQGRLPLLSSHTDDFLLYCPFAITFQALDPSVEIGSVGFRNFMMCKKPLEEKSIGEENPVATRKRSRRWKNWFNKTHFFTSLTHSLETR